MKIIIIGSGLAGGIANGAFSNLNPEIFEAKERKESGLNSHHAVMRIRNLDVAKYLGCEYEEITATKGVYNGMGEVDYIASISSSNRYSKKLYGNLGARSLSALGDVKRYLIKYVPIVGDNVNYGYKLTNIGNGIATFKCINDFLNIGYDFCISTIPMPAILSAAGIRYGTSFEGKGITVLTADLIIDSSVHQTIYIPDNLYSPYRMTIEGKRIIVEAVGKFGGKNLVDLKEESAKLLDMCFGIVPDDYGEFKTNNQPYGKMIAIDDDERRTLIKILTDDQNIFSLGRYAIWKPIRADELITDVERIRRMISCSEAERKYQLSK